ncbi:MAG: redoxin domain-containing protein [Desulfovibrio sp.]|jgi:peroxiredoxin (alkyl hydroperoxide reductase subunit C)|nr:redoxin domain-containing protein [Desulfovibrio sp.]
MSKRRNAASLLFAAALAVVALLGPAPAAALDLKDMILDPGPLKPVDSVIKVRPGQMAPDFSLPGVIFGQGGKRLVHLSDYRGRKNVMLSFVPAAFTPVCSDQWPGYNLAKDLFDEYDTVVLGISVDNLPSQYAWVLEMRGLWFPVLSDFNPHGAVAKAYGVLRGDGTAERAIVIIDKKGVVRFAQSFNINIRPDLELIMRELHKVEEGAPGTLQQDKR